MNTQPSCRTCFFRPGGLPLPVRRARPRVPGRCSFTPVPFVFGVSFLRSLGVSFPRSLGVSFPRFLAIWFALHSFLSLGFSPILFPGSGLRAQDLPAPHEIRGWDALLLPLGAGLSGYGLWLGERQEPLAPEDFRGLDPGDINVFDRPATKNWSPAWSRVSDVSAALVAGWAVTLAGYEGARYLVDGNGSEALVLATVFGEATLLTLGVTAVVKPLVGRKRPFAYNDSFTPEERFRIGSSRPGEVSRSFFSGHTSSAFAAAAFSSALFEDFYGTDAASRLVWGSTLSLATLTAVARVKAGMHFPTDVVVGALVGGAIGYLVPFAHRKEGPDGPPALLAPVHIGLRVPVG